MSWAETFYEIVAPILGYAQVLLTKCIPQWLSNICASSKPDNFTRSNGLAIPSRVATTQLTKNKNKNKNKNRRRLVKTHPTGNSSPQQSREKVISNSLSLETGLDRNFSPKKQQRVHSFDQAVNKSRSSASSKTIPNPVDPVLLARSTALENTRDNLHPGAIETVNLIPASTGDESLDNIANSEWQTQRRRRRNGHKSSILPLETGSKDEVQDGSKPLSARDQLKFRNGSSSELETTASQSRSPKNNFLESTEKLISSDVNSLVEKKNSFQISEPNDLTHASAISQQLKEDESNYSRLSGLENLSNEKTRVDLTGTASQSNGRKNKKAQKKITVQTSQSMTVDIPFRETPDAWIQASVSESRPGDNDKMNKQENGWQVQARRRRRV